MITHRSLTSRMISRRSVLFITLFTVCLGSCKTMQGAYTNDPNGPLRITVIGTNDVHGWVQAQTEKFPQGTIRFGGVAAFGSYVKVLRDENPGGVVLVDAGDLFQGTLMSNITEGAVVIDAYNLLKYDAAAIGNHEFDYGPVGPISAAISGYDAFGALKARIAQAKFPLLSTNIYDASSGGRPSWLPGDGMEIIERHGVKIGIIGLTTPQTPTTTLPINVSTLKFKSLAPEAMTAAKLLRERGAEVVIATIHAGGKCSDLDHPHELSSCDTSTAEIFEMMRGIPAGTIDAVVAGHTHAQVGHFVHGTPVVESWALGRAFGTIELFLDRTSHRVLTDLTRIQSGVEVCETFDEGSQSCDPKRLRAAGADDVRPVPARFHGKPIVPDPEILSAIEPAERQVAELQHRELGLLVPKTLGRNYERESELGSFLADSLRRMSKADVALINPGGLRADLRNGSLLYGEVYEVMPFDNAVATLTLSGEQLERLLKAAYGSKKGVFQVSGLEVTLAKCPKPDRLRRVSLVGGRPLSPTNDYTVVMPDFLARGGDGLGPVLATIEPIKVDLGENRGSNMRDELVSHWQETKSDFEAPPLGRVRFEEDGGDCAASHDAHTGVP